MSQQKNSILINEHALNCEPVPLNLCYFLSFITIENKVREMTKNLMPSPLGRVAQKGHTCELKMLL